MNSPNVRHLFLQLVFMARSINQETMRAIWGVYPMPGLIKIQPRHGRSDVVAAILAAVSPGFALRCRLRAGSQPGVSVVSARLWAFLWLRTGPQDAAGYGRQGCPPLQIGGSVKMHPWSHHSCKPPADGWCRQFGSGFELLAGIRLCPHSGPTRLHLLWKIYIVIK